MTLLFALAMALSAECSALALAADDCTREMRVWEQARNAAAIEWVVVVWPEAA